MAQDAAVGPKADAAPPIELAFDWLGVIGTGQSLSVGATATVLNTTQRFKNLKLSLGTVQAPPFDPNAAGLSLVPLVEPIRPLATSYPGPYPTNIYGETPHTAMSHQMSSLCQQRNGADCPTVHSVVGENGQSITSLEKAAVMTATTGRAYAASLFEAKAVRRLAMSAGKTYGVGAIVLTHGESDNGRPTYSDDLRRLSRDYNEDLKAITGQKSQIPIVLTQQQSFPTDPGTRALSTLVPWRLGVDYPADFLCAGPKYQYQYGEDNIHLPAREYARLGSKYGQVLFYRVIQRQEWKPLQPTSVRRDGAAIVVDFHVPVMPLAWDNTIAPPHQETMTEWKQGRGFEVQDSSGRLTISGVEIDGSSVRISLSDVPKGTGLVVRYAVTASRPVAGGTMRRGQLRDSDSFVGFDSEAIDCQVTKGSTTVRSSKAKAFQNRGIRDVVVGNGVAGALTVSGKASDDELTLATAWPGDSGTARLSFQQNHNNYLVSFELPVP